VTTASPSNSSAGARIVWLAALLLLGAITFAAFFYPVVRISQYADINYNEGWNTYRADIAAHGDPLFGQRPRFTVTNYPPLSFHIVGFVGRFMSGSTAAGRWISLLSLAFLAILIAALVRRFTGHWAPGIYGALLFGLGLAVLLPDRIGMNDPQLLGLAFSFAGFYLYARNPRSTGLLCASAAAFAISLFIKHNLLAFPAAVGLHMLIARAWKPLAVWLATLAAGSVALLLLTFRLDGPYFLAHLLAPRGYSLLNAWFTTTPYLMEFQILFAVALLWSAFYATAPMRSLLVIGFVLAHLLGFAFGGGDGVVQNVFFDAALTVAIITALAVTDLESTFVNLRFGKALMLLALLIPSLGMLTLLPATMLQEHHARKIQLQTDAEFRQAVNFLRSRPGPALCEDLLLCYDAGKPPLFDAYYAHSQVISRHLNETDVLDYIQTSRFPTIEITIPAGQPLLAEAAQRFTQPEMQAILERYRPAVRTSEFALLIPK
jgi:hypothetical protein